MPIYALGERRPRIHPKAWVHPDAVLIGDVWLDAEVSVWPCAVIRADCSPIRVGARTSVQDGCVIHTQPDNQTVIGPDCVLGHCAHLEGCVLDGLVLIGSNSVVLERARCRTGSLVGAGALVKAGTEVPERALAVGSPARIIPDKVNPDNIRLNVQGYLLHMQQQRDGMQRVTLDDCVREKVFD